MCYEPSMFAGTQATPSKPKSVASPLAPPTGPIGADLGNLKSLGQRQLKLPGMTQFGMLSTMALGPPKDITRQV